VTNNGNINQKIRENFFHLQSPMKIFCIVYGQHDLLLWEGYKELEGIKYKTAMT